MANRLIKAAELPPEFAIEKYNVCGTWDLGSWVVNLSRRILTQREIESNLDHPDKKYTEILQSICLHHFNDPEVEYAQSTDGDLVAGEPFEAYACRVRDVNCLEYFGALDIYLDSAYTKYTNAYNFILKSHARFRADGTVESSFDRNDKDAYAEFMATLEASRKLLIETPEWAIEPDYTDATPPVIPNHLPVYESPYAFAKVDLNASDAELVEDFQQWLKHARETRGVVSSTGEFSAGDIQKWSDMRVLAYIDLKSWLLLTGQRVTNAVLGRVLFPDEFDIGLEDRVRKVVADYAQHLTNPRVVRAMQSQYLKAEQK